MKKPTRKRCRRGHRLTGDNIYYRKDGYPACRDCMVLANQRYRERRRVALEVANRA